MNENFSLEIISGRPFLIKQEDDYKFTLDSVLVSYFADLSGNTGSVLDLGCSTGIIEFCLSALKPGIRITGIEIQECLARTALENIRKNSLENVEIRCGDYLEPKNYHKDEYFDLVITNPPYMKPGTGKLPGKESEKRACFEIDMDWKRLLALVNFRMKSNGRFVFIHKASRFFEIMKTIAGMKFGLRRLQFVHSVESTQAHLFMAEIVRNTGIETLIVNPLIIFDDNGKYKGFLKEIFHQ